MKRNREWEPDSGPSKKAANDETRARLDEHPSRRVSPPGRVTTPRDVHRRSSSEIRKDNQRIADQNYHPSEAAHHPVPLAPPPSQLPPQHAGPQGPHTPLSQHPPHIPSMNTMYDAAKEERKEQVEGAARKVNVDEDYDDDGEDDKKAILSAGIGGSGQTSPQGMANMTSQPKAESVTA
jgi:general transcriptional corepressor CYC8